MFLEVFCQRLGKLGYCEPLSPVYSVNDFLYFKKKKLR